MGHLNGITMYLAGPIDNYSGENWRLKYGPEFKKLGIKVYDPLVKPAWMSEVSGCKKIDEHVKSDMKTGLYQQYAKDSSECRGVCLSMLSHSDAVFVYLPKIFTLGTIEEIIEADRQVKPIMFVFDGEGVVSLYMTDLFSRHMTFNNFEEAFMELNNINDFGVNDRNKDFLIRWLPLTHKAI
jgi:hypothetical protein